MKHAKKEERNAAFPPIFRPTIGRTHRWRTCWTWCRRRRRAGWCRGGRRRAGWAWSSRRRRWWAAACRRRRRSTTAATGRRRRRRRAPGRSRRRWLSTRTIREWAKAISERPGNLDEKKINMKWSSLFGQVQHDQFHFVSDNKVKIGHFRFFWFTFLSDIRTLQNTLRNQLYVKEHSWIVFSKLARTLSFKMCCLHVEEDKSTSLLMSYR